MKAGRGRDRGKGEGEGWKGGRGGGNSDMMYRSTGNTRLLTYAVMGREGGGEREENGGE